MTWRRRRQSLRRRRPWVSVIGQKQSIMFYLSATTTKWVWVGEKEKKTRVRDICGTHSLTHISFFFLLLSRAIIDQHPHKTTSKPKTTIRRSSDYRRLYGLCGLFDFAVGLERRETTPCRRRGLWANLFWVFENDGRFHCTDNLFFLHLLVCAYSIYSI